MVLEWLTGEWYFLFCCSCPFRWRCFSAPQQWRQLSDPGQQCLLLHAAGGGQAVAGHVQQGLQTGGGLHRSAHRTGINQRASPWQGGKINLYFHTDMHHTTPCLSCDRFLNIILVNLTGGANHRTRSLPTFAVEPMPGFVPDFPVVLMIASLNNQFEHSIPEHSERTDGICVLPG